MEASTILNQDQLDNVTGLPSHKFEDETFNLADNSTYPSKDCQEKGELTVDKISRNQHERKFSMADIA